MLTLELLVLASASSFANVNKQAFSYDNIHGLNPQSFPSRLSKSIRLDAAHRPAKLVGKGITFPVTLRNHLLDVKDCTFISISGDVAALWLSGQYDSSSQQLGRVTLASSTFSLCTGSTGGAFYICSGIVLLTELCIDQCSCKNGKHANAFFVKKSTSVGLKFVTVSKCSGTGVETCHISEPEESFVTSTNISCNRVTEESGVSSALTLASSEPFQISFFYVERSRAGSVVVLMCSSSLDSCISHCVFTRNSATSFSLPDRMSVENSHFLDSQFSIADTSDGTKIHFKNCAFAIAAAPKIAGCIFSGCSFGSTKLPRFALFSTELCTAETELGIEGGGFSKFFFFSVTLTLGLFAGYYLFPGLRFDLRIHLRTAAFGMSAFTGLLACFWIGGFFGFLIFLAEVGGLAYFFYRFPRFFGEANVERLEGFIKGAKSQLNHAVGITLDGRPQQVNEFGAAGETNPIPVIDDGESL
jgi:hypothetical protein